MSNPLRMIFVVRQVVASQGMDQNGMRSVMFGEPFFNQGDVVSRNIHFKHGQGMRANGFVNQFMGADVGAEIFDDRLAQRGCGIPRGGIKIDVTVVMHVSAGC